MEINKQELTNELLRLPSEVRNLDSEILHLSSDIIALKKTIETEEAVVIRIITADKDELGKPKYPNEASRKAEMLARLATSTFYNDAVKSIEVLEKDVKQMEIERSYLLRRLEVLKVILQVEGRLPA